MSTLPDVIRDGVTWTAAPDARPVRCTCGHLHRLRTCGPRRGWSWGFCEQQCGCATLSHRAAAVLEEESERFRAALERIRDLPDGERVAAPDIAYEALAGDQ